MNRMIASGLLAIGVASHAEAAGVSGKGTWEASLLARDWNGNGVGIDAYFDPALNLTWLADTTYAFTSGYSSSPRLSWPGAMMWVDSLELFGATDWRLPTIRAEPGALSPVFSNNGSTDSGTARTGIGWGVRSELGYMYYVHLGNNGYYTPSAQNPQAFTREQPGWYFFNSGPFDSLFNSEYFTNISG
jgi:hypothetical protein